MKYNQFLIFLTLIIFFFTGVVYTDLSTEINDIKHDGGFEVEVSSLTKFYNTLSVDEKEEQVRDWAMFGLVSRLKLDRDQAGEILHQKFPLRLPYLKNVATFEIAPGRVEAVTADDWVAVLPFNQINNKNVLAAIVDAKRVTVNHIPARIHLFGYTVGSDTQTITVLYTTSLAGQRLFSSEYSYYENRTTNLTEFTQWLSSINDVTYVLWKNNTLILGGRRYETPDNRALTLEDIATVYQAYYPQPDPEKEKLRRQEYEKFVQKKYKEVLDLNPQLKTQIQSGKVTSDQVYREIRRRIPFTSTDEDVNVGFSLDPQKDFSSMSDDINLLADYDPKLRLPDIPEFRNTINSYRNRLKNIAADLKKEKFDSFLVLRRELVDSNNQPLKLFDDILRSIDHTNSYQSARYDGNLKGTSPGMILFYTDLNAKLWAIDLNGMAPKNKVIGFRTMPGIKVPKLYWDEFLKLSGTRLWFGLKSENYNIRNKNLYFAPTVTRVYAASSNPLYPGKESEPNEQSAEFLGWWDRHYSAIADYEPQYYKLDQIQKWSCIFMVLKEEKVAGLEFLKSVSVRRELDFEKWYETTPDLKSKTNLPFVNRKKYNRDTECLLLMQSQPYPIMGQTFFLSGGVSLASKKDILSKLKKTEYTEVKTRTATKPGTKSKPVTTQEKIVVKEQRTVKYEFPQKTTATLPNERKVWKVIPKPGTKLRAPQMELSSAKQEVELAKQPQGLELKYNMNNISYGKFTTRNEPKKVVLNWSEKDGCLLNDLLAEIVAKEESEKLVPQQIVSSIPTIEKIVDKETGKLYFLKLVQTGKWIQLTVNPITSYNKNLYCIRASGTQPESNIYEARILTNDEITKNMLK